MTERYIGITPQEVNRSEYLRLNASRRSHTYYNSLPEYPKPYNIAKRNIKAEYVLLATLGAAALLRPGPDIMRRHSPDTSSTVATFSSQTALSMDQVNDSSRVKKGWEYVILLKNPDGSVRNSLYSEKVVPMDVALLAITSAMFTDSREGDDEYYFDQAESAMDWLMIHTTKKEDSISERYAHLRIDDEKKQWVKINLDGSLWSEYDTKGNHWKSSRRARGEAIGISLDAAMAVERVRPGYIFKTLKDKNGQEFKVLDVLEQMSEFLQSPFMLSLDGRFYHSPEHHKHYGEEQARDRQGLYAAAKAFEKAAKEYPDKADHYLDLANQARAAADRNFFAVKKYGIDVGQSQDPQFQSWAQADPEAKNKDEVKRQHAQEQVNDMEERGLMRTDGVRNYDIQETSNPEFWQRFKYKWYGQTTGYTQLLDFGMLNVTAGDIERARTIADYVGQNQRKDGGIPVGRFPYLQLSYNDAIYTTLRFILLNKQITHTDMQQSVSAKKQNGIQEFLGKLKEVTWDNVRARLPEKEAWRYLFANE